MTAVPPPPAILDVHTPTASFAIVHSLTQGSLQSLQDALTRKVHIAYHGARVGPGWLKYEFNDSIWTLDDDQDYTIFVWRQQHLFPSQVALESSNSARGAGQQTPTLHLHDPSMPLPAPLAYANPSYYLFHPSRLHPPRAHGAVSPAHSRRSGKSGQSRMSKKEKEKEHNVVPKFKQEFDRFHAENGVRTVMGSIGPVKNVRMLLKPGHRHVYISRRFAIRHGFIPKDAALGYYGYAGLVNLGTFAITLTPSLTPPSQHPDDPPRVADGEGQPTPKPTFIEVYLSEEPHFDVVLGRSFFEKRKIRTSSTDPTDVVCLDTGEKIECELVILKDGRGEIVTVT